MRAERNLRRVLTADAASSVGAAIGGLVLAGPVARLLDVSTPAVVAVAAGLVPWAVALALLARSGRDALLQATPWIVAGNALWVVASAVLLAGGVVDRSGWWLVVPMAVAVGQLGLTQAVLCRSLTRPTRTTPALAA